MDCDNPQPEPNRFDAEDCDACAELDVACYYHEGVAVGMVEMSRLVGAVLDDPEWAWHALRERDARRSSIRVGDIVTYHGSRLDLHGAGWEVLAIGKDSQHWHIRRGGETISNVRRQSITKYCSVVDE